MEKEFWETASKRITREMQNEVLSDIVVAIQRKKDAGLLIDEGEMLSIINNLRQEYGN